MIDMHLLYAQIRASDDANCEDNRQFNARAWTD